MSGFFVRRRPPGLVNRTDATLLEQHKPFRAWNVFENILLDGPTLATHVWADGNVNALTLVDNIADAIVAVRQLQGLEWKWMTSRYQAPGANYNVFANYDDIFGDGSNVTIEELISDTIYWVETEAGTGLLGKLLSGSETLSEEKALAANDNVNLHWAQALLAVLAGEAMAGMILGAYSGMIRRIFKDVKTGKRFSEADPWELYLDRRSLEVEANCQFDGVLQADNWQWLADYFDALAKGGPDHLIKDSWVFKFYYELFSPHVNNIRADREQDFRVQTQLIPGLDLTQTAFSDVFGVQACGDLVFDVLDINRETCPILEFIHETTLLAEKLRDCEFMKGTRFPWADWILEGKPISWTDAIFRTQRDTMIDECFNNARIMLGEPDNNLADYLLNGYADGNWVHLTHDPRKAFVPLMGITKYMQRLADMEIAFVTGQHAGYFIQGQLNQDGIKKWLYALQDDVTGAFAANQRPLFLADNAIDQWPGRIRINMAGADGTVAITHAEMLSLMGKVADTVRIDSTLYFIQPGSIFEEDGDNNMMCSPALMLLRTAPFADNVIDMYILHPDKRIEFVTLVNSLSSPGIGDFKRSDATSFDDSTAKPAAYAPPDGGAKHD